MIHYYNEDVDFLPEKKIYLSDWIKHVITAKDRKIGEINFIFCSDAHLITINRSYLQHDDYTDIITFDYCENKKVSGDIFISIDRIKENAEKFKVRFKDELHRVMIHGVLHLCGFKDKSPEDKKRMTQQEDESLEKRSEQLTA